LALARRVSDPGAARRDSYTHQASNVSVSAKLHMVPRAIGRTRLHGKNIVPYFGSDAFHPLLKCAQRADLELKKFTIPAKSGSYFQRFTTRCSTYKFQNPSMFW
jgi:hypothetical protein